jgi:hypothetical protein
MPLRRLPDPEEEDIYGPYKKPPCLSPEHKPPMHMVLEPGRYEWTCPKCGHKTIFVVTGPVWSVYAN